jgi:hypothetical protein
MKCKPPLRQFSSVKSKSILLLVNSWSLPELALIESRGKHMLKKVVK